MTPAAAICAGLSYILCRAPCTPQVLDFYGSVQGVQGVQGFSRTRMGAHAHTRTRTPAHTHARARSPLHTLHTLHKMNEINELECAGHPAQPNSSPAQAPNPGFSPAAGPVAESLAAFARRLGVHRSTVTRAAQAGRLALAPDGSVLIAPSLARWHATAAGRLDVADRHAAARGHHIPAELPAAQIPAPQSPAHPAPATSALATPEKSPSGPAAAPVAPPAASATPATPDAADGPADESGTSRAHAAATTLHWQNNLLRLELGVTQGAYLPRDALLDELNGLGATLRGSLERLTDQLSPRLAAAPSAAERHRLLQAEAHTLRRQLAREFPRALRRLAPESGATTSPQLMQALAEPSQEPGQ